MPAPSKLDLDSREVAQCVQLIENGQHPGTAAVIAGIPRSTFNYWLDRGETDANMSGARGRSRYAAFWRRIDKAKATAEGIAANAVRGMTLGKLQKTQACTKCGWMNTVVVEIPVSLKAAQFYLERTHPDRWGRRDVHRHELANHLPIPEVADLITDLGYRTHGELRDGLRTLGIDDAAAEALLEVVADAWQQLVSAKFPDLKPGGGDEQSTPDRTDPRPRRRRLARPRGD